MSSPILGEIFLRLDSAADLARASAACTAFLRVARFLRRNRSLYRRPVVGFLQSEGPLHPGPRSLHHAEPPHRAASAGRALAQLVDLTFSFLPDPSSWQIRDSSDGRVLLTSGFVDLVVCDPLHRRYVRIPPVPYDLTTGAFQLARHPFLAPAGEEESSFRVIWIMKRDSKVYAFVFTSATWEWRGVTFDGWSGIGGVMLTSCRNYAHRSLYQTSGLFSDVLMLDTRRMEFSVGSRDRIEERETPFFGEFERSRVPVPGTAFLGRGTRHRSAFPVTVSHSRLHAIVDAGEGRLGLLTIGDDMVDLYCKAWQDNNAGAEEWQHEKTIPLPDADSLRYTFSGAGSGYLLLQAIPQDPSELASSSQEVPKIQYFILEVKTLLIERLCLSNKRIDFARLYANFLPPLSLPSV
ncbi:unnamed protein product [Urochloa decumbens]|uniref:F-box protein n=1 Tax=Urochloa decumbens TaxID=240449 RepID=A0ABC8W919_9POAL